MRDELFHTCLSRQWQLQYKEIHHQRNTYEREGLLIWSQDHQIEINSLSVTFWCATHISQSSTAGRAQGEGTGDGKEVSAAFTCATGRFRGLAMLGGKGQFGHAEPKLSSCWLQLGRNVAALYCIHLISQRTVLFPIAAPWLPVVLSPQHRP